MYIEEPRLWDLKDQVQTIEVPLIVHVNLPRILSHAFWARCLAPKWLKFKLLGTLKVRARAVLRQWAEAGKGMRRASY